MVTDNPTLKACLESADAIETALNSLGDTSQWPADHALRQQCAEFRHAARDLAEQKGLDQFVIAFIGPKNAGKTTLLSMLLRSEVTKQQLSSGEGLRGTTEKVLWLSSQPIPDLDRQVEESLHVSSSDLVNLGCDYTLIDVPGANEAHQSRVAAASRALRTAHLKVLVMEARTMEDASLLDYMEGADGATILPVINQIRPGTEDQDVSRFMASLKQALPNSHILSPLRIDDFQLAGQASAEEVASVALQGRLREVVRSEHLEDLLEPQLLRMKARFQEDMQTALTTALPATAEAARDLQQIESNLAVEALERLLGADDRDLAVITGLRQQIRGLYQQRTPVLFFPWRTFVSLANLLHGALEKVPLLLVGSLPSLIGSAITAVKNVTQDREFRESRKEGLRTHAELLVKESLHPRVDHLEAAIRSDLRIPQ
ncbi:MAG: Rab family GTPase, partial [Verrucomicrobiales bacterium]